MKKSARILFMLHTFILQSIFLQSCSTEQLYHSVQYNQKARCQKLPYAQYSECMQQASESYGDYNRKREAVINEKK